MRRFPQKVNIVEVGPRDGLQNEPVTIPTAAKLAFIQALGRAGLQQIEAGSFVHPKLVPQLADADEILAALNDCPGPVYSALVPNERGLDRALAAGVRRIAVFTAASESFTKKNIGMTIAESLEVFGRVIPRAVSAGVSVRAYLSTAFVCPFEGKIDGTRVADLTVALLNLGADEIAVSDTIGAAVPTDIFTTVGLCIEKIPAAYRSARLPLALHFHDTYGTALANTLAGLELGIDTFDSSAGGLGGCPFAPGASGNLATEDLVYMLSRMGIATGIDLDAVVDAASVIAKFIDRPLYSAAFRRRYGTSSCRMPR